MTIRRLEELGEAEVHELAHSAADRQESLAEANPFPAGSDRAIWFKAAFLARRNELAQA